MTRRPILALTLAQLGLVSISNAKGTCSPPDISSSGLTWESVDGNDQVFFALSNNRKTYNNANRFCKNLVGNEDSDTDETIISTALARLESQDENDFLANLALQKWYNYVLWTSGTSKDSFTGNPWVWFQLTNEEAFKTTNFTFQNWGHNQPMELPGLDCLSLSDTNNGNNGGFWYNRDCTTKMNFACEYRCQDNDDNPPIFDSGSEWIQFCTTNKFDPIGYVDLMQEYEVEIDFYTETDVYGVEVLNIGYNQIDLQVPYLFLENKRPYYDDYDQWCTNWDDEDYRSFPCSYIGYERRTEAIDSYTPLVNREHMWYQMDFGDGYSLNTVHKLRVVVKKNVLMYYIDDMLAVAFSDGTDTDNGWHTCYTENDYRYSSCQCLNPYSVPVIRGPLENQPVYTGLSSPPSNAVIDENGCQEIYVRNIRIYNLED